MRARQYAHLLPFDAFPLVIVLPPTLDVLRYSLIDVQCSDDVNATMSMQ